MLAKQQVVAKIDFSKDSAKKMYEFVDRFKIFVLVSLLVSIFNLIIFSLKIANIVLSPRVILSVNAQIFIDISLFFVDYILALGFFLPAFSRFNKLFIIKQDKNLHLSRIFMLSSFLISLSIPIMSRIGNPVVMVISSIFIMLTIVFDILTWWTFTKFLKILPEKEFISTSYKIGYIVFMISSSLTVFLFLASLFTIGNLGATFSLFFFINVSLLVSYIGLLKCTNILIDGFSERNLQKILPSVQRGQQKGKSESKLWEKTKDILFLIPAYIALIVFVFLPIAFAFIISAFENPSTLELANYLQYYFNFPTSGTFFGNISAIYSDMFAFITSRTILGSIVLGAILIYFVIQVWWLVNRRFKNRRSSMKSSTRTIVSVILGIVLGLIAFIGLIFIATRFNTSNLANTDLLSFFLLPSDVSYSYKGVLLVNGIVLLTSILLMVFYTRFVYRKLEKFIKDKIPRISIAFLVGLISAPLTIFLTVLLLYFIGIYIVLPIREFQRIITIESLDFMRIFFNSFFWTLTCTALHVIIGVALAVVLNRSFPGRDIARSLLILPWAVPSFVSTLMWRAYVFDNDKGFLGSLAATFPESYVFTTAHLLSFAIGITVAIVLVILLIRAINKAFRISSLLKSIVNFVVIVAGFFVGGVLISLLMRSFGTVDVGLFGYRILDIPQILDTFWITDSIYIFGVEFKMITFSAILINVWLGVPFMMLSFLATLQSIPKDLYEAADIDGLTGWDKFKRITLPLLKPTLLTVSLLGIIWTFNLFNVVYILSQNQNGLGDATKYDIFVTFIYERFSRAQPQYSQAAALSITVFFILISFSLVYRRLIQAEKIWEGDEQ